VEPHAELRRRAPLCDDAPAWGCGRLIGGDDSARSPRLFMNKSSLADAVALIGTGHAVESSPLI